MRTSLRKILLVQPPAFSNNHRGDMNPNLPLGIAYIASTLERHGYDVQMLDAFIEGWDVQSRINDEKILVGMPYSQVEDFIAATAPDVVGVTSMFTSQRKNAHRIAAIARKVNPDIKVIFGGAHPTSAPESVLADPNVDAIVLGEGDNTIVPLLQCLESGGALSQVDGIGYRGPHGPVLQQKTIQIEHLDELPFPARHLLPMEKYFSAGVRHGGYSVGERSTSMITSRGCQYHCNFCTAFKVFTRVPRMRSIENIVAELTELVTKYKVDEIFFEDDQFIAKQRHTEGLLDAMAKFNLAFDTPNGISSWLLTEDLIKKMKQAGCYRVNLAIESGNQDVLREIINKPVNLDKVPGLVKIVRRNGMKLDTFLVVGNIGRDKVETLDQVRDSFRFSRQIRARPHVSYLTAYPGSEVLEIAQDKGYLIPGFDWDDLTILKQQLETPQWTREQLRQVVDEERLKTHLWYWLTSPREIAGILLADPVGSIKKLWNVCRSAATLWASHMTQGRRDEARVSEPRPAPAGLDGNQGRSAARPEPEVHPVLFSRDPQGRRIARLEVADHKDVAATQLQD